MITLAEIPDRRSSSVESLTTGPEDRTVSVLTAALGELPLANVLMRGTLSMVRLSLTS